MNSGRINIIKDNKIKDDEMGGVCSTHGRKDIPIQSSVRKRDHLEKT
jgi:hypothetical protein